MREVKILRTRKERRKERTKRKEECAPLAQC